MPPSSLIQRVLIVGATHGNELIGAYIIQKLEQYPELLQRSSFETLTLLANPRAFAAARRYIDTDLNRCFRQQDLVDPNRTTYEELRAKEINQRFGKTGETPVDVIFDLHSTTANMGMTVIIYSSPFNLRLAAYLQQSNPLVNVLILAASEQGYSGLPAICGQGCTVEVGAVAPGILQAELFQQTEKLLEEALDYLESYQNRANMPLAIQRLTAYQQVRSVDYPRNAAGEIQAMIHPQLQSKDYEPLSPGDPMFLPFSGEVICYTGSDVVYPVFINEAAYYEKGIAMILAQKQEFEL